jgi:septal ring factor EnvC (AmiA/AmiB activator)
MAVVNLMEKLFEIVRGDVAELKTDVAELKTRMGAVENRLAGLENQLDRFEVTVAEKFVALETTMSSQFAQTSAMLQQLVFMNRGTAAREQKLAVSIDDHEERIATLEGDPPVPGRPPKH